MGLFKKNPVFCSLCGIFILIFAAGCYLTFAAFGKASKSQKQIKSTETQLQSYQSAMPSPTQENVEASAANVKELAKELAAIRENLEKGSRLTVSKDGTRVMAGVQQFISEFQRKVAMHTVTQGDQQEPAEIVVPDNFAFGFQRYIDTSTPPEKEADTILLDRQRQILTYILNQLIASNPTGIQLVQREVLETGAVVTDKNKVVESSGFVISAEESARVPNAIHSLAFKITFTGYTDTLRQFLNNLSSFDLPIVVRSVTVTRPKSTTSDAAARPKNNLDDIFGAFGGASTTASAAPAQPEQTPVITDNTSSFTVVLEFIEIILPSELVADPA